MTVVIRIGRRYRKGFVDRMKGPYMVQNLIWRNVDYGFMLAEKKMKSYQKKNPTTFKYTKTKFNEEEKILLREEKYVKYILEWIEINITSTPEIEEEEYNESLKLFENLENLPALKKRKDKVEVDENLSKEYNKTFNSNRIQKMLDAGYERIKNVSINKSLNDVGILTIVEKYENRK